jgi:hypothetical protein
MEYTDADAVLILDSDEMLVCNVTPSTFRDYHGRWRWAYRNWDNAGSANMWKVPTQQVLQFEPQYEAMCFAPFIFERKITYDFIEYLKKIHGAIDLFDVFFKYDMTLFSEYNAYGSYVLKFDNTVYYSLINNFKGEHKLITKSWSYGGVSKEEKEKREKILNDNLHKTNILVVSFPRSGFHLLQTIFNNYFNIKECDCQRNPDVKVEGFINSEIAAHRSHDMNLELNKAQFNKIIILYRKDVVEQLDAFFRYQFRTFDVDGISDDMAFRHTQCDELAISYSSKLDFFRIVLKQYKDWVQKWINEPTPNSIIIEYSYFIKNPQKTLDRIQEHLLETKDSELSAKIVEEMKIEYKHSITLEKYQKLANILLRL